LTLPLVTMGGTSVLFTCISLGMILSVSKYIESIE
jgi:cell division protein FtsW